MSNSGFDVGDSSTDPDTKYRFVPVVRRGYSPDAYYDAQSEQGTDSIETKGTLGVDVSATGTEGSQSATEKRHVGIQLYGPGHVTGLDRRQVVRMEPEPGTTNYPPNYLATVEFDAPDLLWLFSPVADETVKQNSSGTGKGFPWLCLVVLEKTEELSVEPAGSDRPLPSVEAPYDELPPLDEAWAWAHAQVVGSPAQKGSGSDGGSSAADPLADAFESQSTLTRSRLISPRNLEPNTQYLAAVVPTFEAGVRAGLGKPVKPDDGSGESTNGNGNGNDGPEMAPLAWPIGKTAYGKNTSSDTKELPVYHHWEFSTGQRGDFEYLARQLEPRNLSSDEYDIGTRTVDVTDPGPDALDLAGAGEGDRTVRMGGALQKAGSDPIDADEYAMHEPLRELLNRPGTIDEWTDEDYTAKGPPIYGGKHAQRETIPKPIHKDQQWLWDLNLNPGNRLAAAVGTSIVRDKQEQLMEKAWDQVGQVRKANRTLAAAQLAREALETTLPDLRSAPTGWTATFTAPMHDRLLGDGQTVGAQLDGSSMPRGLTTAPFRRLLSGSGRLADRLDAPPAVGDIVEDVAAGDLTVATQTRGPDGMGTVDREARLDDLCVALPDEDEDEDDGEPGEVHEKVETVRVHLRSIEKQCRRTTTRLRELSAALRERSSGGSGGGGSDEVPRLAEDIESDWDELAPTIDYLAHAMTQVARIEADRDLPRVSDEFTESRATSLHDDLSDAALGDLFASGPTLASMSDVLTQADVGQAQSTVVAVLDAVATIRRYFDVEEGSDVAYLDGLVCGSVPEREPAADPDLEAATTIDPVGALCDRIQSRVDGVDLKASHRRDPFDRVMAYPKFPKPTYDDLKEQSEDHLLPGVEAVPKDTFGALRTNPQFIESFLVGMNQEMASELLWRRFPTDCRGSYFRQFWDPSARVPKPATEEDKKDITEIHTWDDKDDPDVPGRDRTGRSELGSNVMTGTGTGANEDAGTGPTPNSQVVVVIRGELLRRYPSTTIYAAKAKRAKRTNESAQDRVPEWPTPKETDEQVDTTFHRYPIFRGKLDPDVTFLGFDLTADEATGETSMESVGDPEPADDDHWVDDDGTDDEGWFFVLEEAPGEVRFGLDANQGDAGKTPPGITDRSGNPEKTDDPDENPEHGWSALSWGHLVGSGEDPSDRPHVSVYRDRPGKKGWKTEADEPWTEDGSGTITEEEVAVWGKNSADMAYITWQRPVRIAIHADDLLPVDTGGSGGN